MVNTWGQKDQSLDGVGLITRNNICPSTWGGAGAFDGGHSSLCEFHPPVFICQVCGHPGGVLGEMVVHGSKTGVSLPNIGCLRGFLLKAMQKARGLPILETPTPPQKGT